MDVTCSPTRRFVRAVPDILHVYLTVRHLQWSGADYVDNLMKTVTGGVSSTAAMGKGVTEAQFSEGPKAKL